MLLSLFIVNYIIINLRGQNNWWLYDFPHFLWSKEMDLQPVATTILTSYTSLFHRKRLRSFSYSCLCGFCIYLRVTCRGPVACRRNYENRICHTWNPGTWVLNPSNPENPGLRKSSGFSIPYEHRFAQNMEVHVWILMFHSFIGLIYAIAMISN